MKTNRFAAGLLAMGLFAMLSCRQDPIFYTISKETARQDALITGTPTNMVIFEREYPDPANTTLTVKVPILYVATNRLYWYAKTGLGIDAAAKASWNLGEYRIPQPGGKIIALAATGDYLYALCRTGNGINFTLRRIGAAQDEWKTVSYQGSDAASIQCIYADPAAPFAGRLFASVRTSSKDKDAYTILYLDDTDPTAPELKTLKSETSMLSGAVSSAGIHYLCTSGSGIFQIAESALGAGFDESLVVHQLDANDVADPGKQNRTFMGMLELETGTIIAIERSGGSFYEVNNGSFERIKYDSGSWITTGNDSLGALALWTDPVYSGTKMLIASIQGNRNSYTHGYVEFDLNSDGSLKKADTSRRNPGSLKSVSDNGQYLATIGKYPINHLFQAPKEIDEDMTFFASTHNEGLWSYRDLVDSGGPQWNAETDN